MISLEAEHSKNGEPFAAHDTDFKESDTGDSHKDGPLTLPTENDGGQAVPSSAPQCQQDPTSRAQTGGIALPATPKPVISLPVVALHQLVEPCPVYPPATSALTAGNVYLKCRLGRVPPALLTQRDQPLVEQETNLVSKAWPEDLQTIGRLVLRLRLAKSKYNAMGVQLGKRRFSPLQ
ncbi:hypothetical protein NM208_g9516 [Fusarium decemcellulare]|uniref:Uncharacterized protein n=1 Tax=Fusarium decemcellulare TaxID=57161 RepID=A0ACC1S198_9HYPO|nr:hypothetical protein NM208_g9516 [Fusarium decemcellulare]